MKFRIVEFLQANEDGYRFFIEKGTKYFLKFFVRPKIAWEIINDDKGNPIAFKTMGEAVLAVNHLKDQLPIYHEIK